MSKGAQGRREGDSVNFNLQGRSPRTGVGLINACLDSTHRIVLLHYHHASLQKQHRWAHDAPTWANPGRSNRTGPHCHAVLLRRARRAASPAACQALLYCCDVPVVPGPAAVVALPAPTWFGLGLGLGFGFGLGVG